jgi:hypothetical protein
MGHQTSRMEVSDCCSLSLIAKIQDAVLYALHTISNAMHSTVVHSAAYIGCVAYLREQWFIAVLAVTAHS